MYFSCTLLIILSTGCTFIPLNLTRNFNEAAEIFISLIKKALPFIYLFRRQIFFFLIQYDLWIIETESDPNTEQLESRSRTEAKIGKDTEVLKHNSPHPKTFTLQSIVTNCTWTTVNTPFSRTRGQICGKKHNPDSRLISR